MRTILFLYAFAVVTTFSHGQQTVATKPFENRAVDRQLKPPAEPGKPKGKRPGSPKRKKTKNIRIDHEEILVPENLPAGAKLEGYRDFVVQDILLETHNTCYRRAVYRRPDGSLTLRQRNAKELAQSAFWKI